MTDQPAAHSFLKRLARRVCSFIVYLTRIGANYSLERIFRQAISGGGKPLP